MTSWVRESVVRSSGTREHEGEAKPHLTNTERKAIEKRLMRKRNERVKAGKRTYQNNT